MAIFNHTDCDGDSMEIRGAVEGDLVVCLADRDGSCVSTLLDRDAEARLYAALTERVGDRVGPGPDPVYTALVRRLVAEEVARVLPLHLAPFAEQVQVHADKAARLADFVHGALERPAVSTPCAHNGFCRDANGVQHIQCPEPDAEDGWRSAPGFCTIPDCDRSALGQANHLEHDPAAHEGLWRKPGDCGTDPEPWRDVDYCMRPYCGHPRDMHGQGFSTTCACGACSEFTTDPEPRDVGHPQPTDWSDRLWNGEPVCPWPLKPGQTLAEVHTACGHLWAIHKAAPKPRLMAEVKAVRDMELAGAECTCTHKYDYVHSGDGCTLTGCECTWDPS